MYRHAWIGRSETRSDVVTPAPLLTETHEIVVSRSAAPGRRRATALLRAKNSA